MRYILLFCTLCGLTLSLSAQVVTDTLEANVGSRARILFLAKTADDFAELSKYDLNALFNELYQREFGDNKKVKLLDDDEAGLLSFNARQRSFPLRLGFYAGFPITSSFLTPIFEIRDIPEIGEEPEYNFSNKKGRITGRGSLGASISFDPVTINRSKMQVTLRTSVGFEWTGYQIEQPDFAFASPELRIRDSVINSSSGTNFTEYIYDTLSWNSSTVEPRPLKGSFAHVYAEVMPVVQLKKKNGKIGWRFGAGLRFGPDITRNDNPTIFSQTQASPFLSLPPEAALIAPANPVDWHYTWLAMVGYGKFSVQMTYIPNAIRQSESYFVDSDFYGQSSQQINAGLVHVGLRYGL